MLHPPYFLVSKPPSPAFAERVFKSSYPSKKKATVCFIGADEPNLPDNVSFSRTLKAAAEEVTGSSGKEKKL
ncbi:MAG: hypothetical protein CM1200mP30_16580 [Pseudomonadota bacterium]|nr:MAG: hypothetical protein CM1200mP30_16580 [Pseudomonadota bacterium]